MWSVFFPLEVNEIWYPRSFNNNSYQISLICYKKWWNGEQLKVSIFDEDYLVGQGPFLNHIITMEYIMY